MTPAVKLLKKNNIEYTLHQYKHDNAATSYGKEAIEKMGVESNRVFKTLVVELDASLAVAVVPALKMLNMKKIAKATKSKKAKMAEALMVERATGYILGGVSPLAQKKRLATYIDSSASEFKTIYVSAGRRGLEVELSPNNIATLTDAVFAEIC